MLTLQPTINYSYYIAVNITTHLMHHTVASISFSYYSVEMATKGELHVTRDVEVTAS